jgi:hypothetical protein
VVIPIYLRRRNRFIGLAPPYSQTWHTCRNHTTATLVLAKPQFWLSACTRRRQRFNLEGKNQNHKTEKSQHKQKDTQMRFCFYQGHAEKMDFKFKLLPSPVNPKNLHLIKLFSILITIKGDFQQATKRNDFTPTYCLYEGTKFYSILCNLVEDS